MWKKNLLENLEVGEIEIGLTGEFLLELIKEFGEEDKKLVKVAKLKKAEQGRKTIEKFVQKFRRVARESEYEERVLIEEFKRGINRVIRQKLMKIERLPANMKQ